MLAIPGETVVLAEQGSTTADLRGLLTEQRHPQAKLALALQCGRFLIEAADQDQVAVQPAQVVVGQVGQVVDIGRRIAAEDPLALRVEQLDHLGATVHRLPQGEVAGGAGQVVVEGGSGGAFAHGPQHSVHPGGSR